jgi:4-hydroxy-tetrahydrodipicolinate synthase
MRGVWTALVTPFNEQNEIDFHAFRQILKDQVEAGVSGVIPGGTTGESPTLTLEEKKLLIQCAIEELKGSKTLVVAGTGSNNTQASLEFSKWADRQGAHGIMLVTPYYNKPSQAGLELHFKTIADAVSGEVVLYNVPGRTGVGLTAETIAQLAKHPKITALKEATGNVAFTSEILDHLGLQNQSLDILSGDDATYLPLLSVGASGVISVASNLFPRAMVAIQNAADTGNLREAQAIHKKYYPLFRDLFIETNPVPIKHALSKVGLCQSHVRAPLVPLAQGNMEKLNQSLLQCRIKKGTPA